MGASTGHRLGRRSVERRSRLEHQRRAALAIGQVGIVLGAVGIILGASALAVTLTRLGPVGPVGPVGLLGPRGNGTVVATHAHESGFPKASPNCTLWSGANISINVTGPGIVVVSGFALIYVDHTIETEDIAYLYVQNGTSPCTGAYTTLMIPSGEPSTVVVETLPAQGVFTVPFAANDTFTVMDEAASGADVSFGYISLVAVFYPT